MRPFVLSSSAVRLEVPTRADVEAIVTACRDEEVRRFTTVPVPYDRGDAERFVDGVVDPGWATGRELTWGVRGPGSSELLGVVAVRPRHRDLGFWLTPAARGRGLVTAAVHLVCDHVFAEGWPDVLWEGYVGNDASAAVARRCGFTYEGVGPGLQPGRERGGPHPLCWRGRLRAGDDRTPRPGWPDVGARPSSAPGARPDAPGPRGDSPTPAPERADPTASAPEAP